MKAGTFIAASILIMNTIGSGCSQEIKDPVFNYNLKSAKVIETNNQFGLELFQKVLEEEYASNVMISPASVSIALGMAYNGAETTTREAFEEVLNYEGMTREEINEITRELISVLVANTSGNLVEIANSMWHHKDFPVEEQFIDLNTTYYDASVRELDFRGAEAVDIINGWVKSKTRGKIDQIIDSIDPETMMILINAIYFNCIWETEFDPEETREAPFYHSDGTFLKEVDMMQLESTFHISFTDEFSAVELPYKNKKFSMYLFLPPEGTTVEEMVTGLDGETWNSWLETFSEAEDFNVDLPKFKFEYERSLSDDLKKMGLGIAFTEQADFSGISPVDLLISEVIHKTYIEVNEEGTEAAAVTAVVFEMTSIGGQTSITLNRPFLIAITENSSRSILFMGKVASP